jgi:hypothetical protein
MVSYADTKEPAAEEPGPPEKAATSSGKKARKRSTDDDSPAVTISAKGRKKKQKGYLPTDVDKAYRAKTPKAPIKADEPAGDSMSFTAYFSAPEIAKTDRGSDPVLPMLEMQMGKYATNFKHSSVNFDSGTTIADDAAEELLEAASAAMIEKLCSRKFVKKYLVTGCGASKLTLMSQTRTALKDIFMNNQKRMLSDAALWTKKGKPSVDKLRDSVKEHEDELLKIQANTAMKGCEAITKLLTQAQHDIAQKALNTSSAAAATKAATDVISEIQHGLNELIAGISKDEAGGWKLPTEYSELEFAEYKWIDEDDVIIPNMTKERHKKMYNKLAPIIDSSSVEDCRFMLESLHNEMIAANVSNYNMHQAEDFPTKKADFTKKFGLTRERFVQMKLLEDRLDVHCRSPGEVIGNSDFSSPSSPTQQATMSPHFKVIGQYADMDVECTEDLRKKLDAAANDESTSEKKKPKEGCKTDKPTPGNDSDDDDTDDSDDEDEDTAAEAAQLSAAIEESIKLNSASEEPPASSEDAMEAADSPMTSLMKSDYKTWDKTPRWGDHAFRHILFTPN